MKQDIFGQQVTLETDPGLRDWNATQLAFLSHSAQTADLLAAVLRAEPGFALGLAVKGLFCLLQGRCELNVTAAEALRAARAAAAQGDITPRESRYLAALAAWLVGKPTLAVAEMEAVLDRNPGDTMAMKLSHAIRFVLGDAAGMRRSVEALLPAYALDHPGRGYLLGCHAFALEETGDYERAEIAGRQALWQAPDDAWGLHAVAHVHEMTGRARQGLAWLTGREEAWSHCNNFRYHVWWHKALLHLDRGEIDAVFDLYDQEIRKDHTDDYRDISNGASLLMRLELEGLDVGGRWDEMAQIAARRTEDGSLIFADLHYLLALTHGDEKTTAHDLIRRIARDAQSSQTDSAERMAAPGLDAAEGLLAFSETRHGDAFRHLCRARATMQLAGGSHAQRDVFERITIDAGIRAGCFDQAEQLLAERQAQRAGTEDAYAAARRALIAAGREPDHALRVPVR